jgi:hypothetical protein
MIESVKIWSMTQHFIKGALAILAVVASLTVPAQGFEGKIIYQNSFKSKVPNVSDQQLSSVIGSRQEYYIKKGNYKSITNGTYIQWQIYINKDNRL